MANTLAFFNGVRLWDVAQALRAVPAASGAATKQGMSKIRARVNNRSPNHLYEITVHTTIAPVTAIDTNYGRQATHHLYNLQTQKRLVEQSRSFGHLAWCPDGDKKNEVTGTHSGGAAVTVTLADYSGFTPSVGDLVLFRDPTTGDGFVTTVDAVGAGPPYSVTVDLQRTGLDRSAEDVDVDSNWSMYWVAYYFPMCQFVRPQWREIQSQAEDKYSFNVQWMFRSEEHAVWAAAANLDLE